MDLKKLCTKSSDDVNKWCTYSTDNARGICYAIKKSSLDDFFIAYLISTPNRYETDAFSKYALRSKLHMHLKIIDDRSYLFVHSTNQ